MAKYHTVQQGECFSSLASKYGFKDYRSIYDHSENAELKEKRKIQICFTPMMRFYSRQRIKRS